METTALKLLRECDEDKKGYISKHDIRKLQYETGLTAEQLEAVFDALDSSNYGYLTYEQFLDAFRKYTVEPSHKSHILERTDLTQLEELNETLNLIKETHVLQTSAEELECICEQMKSGTMCEFSQWERFIKALNYDLQTYKQAHSELEFVIREKEIQHQNYVEKIFEEVDCQRKQDKETEEVNEAFRRKMEDDVKKLHKELLLKDELLQQLHTECQDLKVQLSNLQKKESELNTTNHVLLDQQSQYELQLENEKRQKTNFYTLLKNIKRRSSLERCHYFNEGFNLAKKIVSVQEEGLMKQLRILQDMHKVLTDG